MTKKYDKKLSVNSARKHTEEYESLLLIKSFFHTKTFKIVLIFSLSWVYAVSANVSINLPFGLVPITLQTLSCYLLTLLFGWVAVNAYFLYLMQGILGVPFFSNGSSGLLHLCGPTGGYLGGIFLGMILLTFLRNKHSSSCFFIFVKLISAEFILYFCGLLQLSLFVGQDKLFYVGFYPFIIGDFIKILITTFIAAGFYKSVELR